MKRILLLFWAVCSALGSLASTDFTGKVVTLTRATSLAEGQWYALYNSTDKTWFAEGTGNKLAPQSATPAITYAEANSHYFVKLVTASNGNYYVQTAAGNYLGTIGSTTATATTPYVLAPMSEATNQWSLQQQGGKYLGGLLTASNSPTGWTFFAITLKSESQLTASQRLTYQGKLLSQDGGALLRFYSKRNTARYLTSSESGAAKGAAKVSATDLTSIWIVKSSGTGYTFRNAQTGEFLTGDFGTPGAETKLYMQQSPDNGTTGFYYNISSAEDFSGTSCLNLGNDGATLYKWSHAGDAGSAWAAEAVWEVSMDEVRQHLTGNNPYATELKDGKYYRIVNDKYGTNMSETNALIACKKTDENNYAQYWKLEKNGENWRLRNVFTNQYILRQTSLSTRYTTGTLPTDFHISSTGDAWKSSWYIANTKGGNTGLHCDASSRVVVWTTVGNEASRWLFEEVALTEEDIANARQTYQEYENLTLNLSTYQTALDNLFQDKACTTLKSNIASLTDEQLAANADYKALPTAIRQMVMKVKNNTWTLPTTTSPVTQSYEKFFRVADYKPYSNYSEMPWRENTGTSNLYGKLSGPTGIVINTGDVLYLYVEQSPHADCTLEVEVVSTDGVPGNNQTGATTSLRAGLNVIQASEQSNVYIFYQLNNTAKRLAAYPDIKIHIEGGTVNGMMDVTRGMTNQDWANLRSLNLMQASPVLNLKTQHLVFAMNSTKVLEAMTAAARKSGDTMEDAEKLLRIWDRFASNPRKLLGLDEMADRFNNIWNVFSIDYQYMFASNYGTYYNESTLPSIMDYYNQTHQGEGNEGGALWGPSHEIGHNHQAQINVVGTTESSVNLFSNINIFEQGVSTTRYSSPMKNFNEYLAKGLAWNDRTIEVTTRMYFQLYLYFHIMGHDTTFYPRLFKALRADGINKGTWDNSLTADTDGDGVIDVTGGYRTNGANDYLHLAKKICDVAQADLSEFFEAYGMFVPVSNRHVGDYSNYWVTTTQADIDAAKRYMRRYSKKLGNLMFIDDHISQKKADPNNPFEAVPASNGNKVNCCTYAGSKVGTAGTAGDFELFDGHTNYDVSGTYYTISGSTIKFAGEGYVGHKVYDLDGNLIWATNSTSATIPTNIRSKFPAEVVVVAAEQNMNDVPCPYYLRGTSPIYKMDVAFTDGTTKQWWANSDIDAYLPQNAVALVGTSDAPEALLASTNVVNTDGTAKTFVIDGDQPFHLAQDITATNLTFKKSGTGYQALNLPFDLSNGRTVTTEGKVIPAATVAAGTPAVVEGSVNLALTNVPLKAGNFTASENGYVLNAEANAVEAAETVSPFTYAFDSAFAVTFETAINDILSAPNAQETVVYDLNGRRVYSVKKAGVYLINGQKTLVK